MAALYSSLKFLRFTDHLEALRNERMVAPVHVRIKPTNTCNHHCWYCAYRTDDLQLGADMVEKDRIPEAKMAEITDDLIAMGVKAVTFSGGGEPLLYRALPETVERLAQGGVKVATLTNGTNLRGRMADAFATFGTWVRISVDAWDDDSYTRSRGARPGEFTRLLDNIQAFVARGSRCVLGVSFIVGHDNHTHIAEVCTRLRDLGINHVKVSGAVVGNDGASNNAYHASIKDEVSRQLEVARRLQTADFTVLDHYHELSELFAKSYSSCPFLMFLTVIGADLSVYTCQDKAYTADGILGSLRGQSFRDFWFSEDNRRQLFAFNPSVSCSHHCVSHAKNLSIHEYLNIDADHGLFV